MKKIFTYFAAALLSISFLMSFNLIRGKRDFLFNEEGGGKDQIQQAAEENQNEPAITLPVQEIIASNRRIVWSAGVSGGIPDVPVLANVKNPPYNAAGDGIIDDTAAILSAIAAVTNGAVYFPAGNYLITSQLNIWHSLVLRGAGSSNTHLLFNHTQTAIGIVKYAAGGWIHLGADAVIDSTRLTLSNAAGYLPGQYAEIQQDNDPAVMYTSPLWDVPFAAASAGQILKVTAVNGNEITFEPPLRLTYQAALNPVIRSKSLIENAGIEDLHLKRLDTNDCDMVSFKNAAHGWMKGCESQLARKSHVNVEASYRIEIRDSFFNDATSWGGGGHGYGVQLGQHVSDCLVENNSFYHLRHSMMVQLGANGNIFGYNYSKANYQSEGGTWTPGDISLHGHYPFCNLFEGNIVAQVEISDYWGPCGPKNTFLRNCVESNNMSIKDEADGQNFVGNELLTGSIVWDATVNSNSLLMHGNRAFGVTSWDSTISNHVLPVSYYLSNKPAFYGAMQWPSAGSDISNAINPARSRYAGP